MEESWSRTSGNEYEGGRFNVNGVGIMNQDSDKESGFERLLSLPEVARILGVCVRSVTRSIDRGELPRPVRVGHAVRLFKSDVDSYLQGLREHRTNSSRGGER
jgi:excisionase family DNA binding protein